MSKTFLVYIEDDSVGGSHIMHALRHMKKYHHVQDVTKIEPMAELAALREAVEAARALANKWRTEGEKRHTEQGPAYTMLSTLAGCAGALDEIFAKLEAK